MKNFLVPFLALGLALVAGPARADDAITLDRQAADMERLSAADPARAQQGVAADFAALAGSADNAGKLVAGLRSGTDVDLVWTNSDGQSVTTTIDPATGAMGLGNVFISLALAQESLQQSGIASPTPEQLAVALNGGTILVDGKTITLQGVLAQRAGGAGWGRIAQSLGVRLGAVVSAIRSENGRLRAAEATRRDAAKAEAKRELAARADKGERSGRPERADRPQVDRPNRPDRPDRPDRAR